jgi:hypothetical protein
MMEKGDVWNEVDGLKRREKRIWHIHPEKLREHIEKLGLHLGRIATLKEVQDQVVFLPCLQPGAKGMYDQNTDPTGTFCNHAVFLTIQAVDSKYKQFIGHNTLYTDDEPPYELARLKSPLAERLAGYLHKRTNIWCEILKEQAECSEKTGIYLLEAEEAQEKANQGYVVIGAWKNPKHGDNNPPHYVTVRPGFEYDSDEGPMLANVGTAAQTEKEILAGRVFSENLNNVKWYYNAKQEFVPNFKRIIELEAKQ